MIEFHHKIMVLVITLMKYFAAIVTSMKFTFYLEKKKMMVKFLTKNLKNMMNV